MMDPLEHLQMMKDRAAGLPPRQGDFTRVRALRCTDPGFDRAVWRDGCTRQDWLGMLLPEDAGGSAQGIAAFCAAMEQLGRDLWPEPVIAAAMAAQLLPADRLAPVLAGEQVVLPAWQETPGAITPIGETVLRQGRLTGRKLGIPMAAGADMFLVTLPDGLALVRRDAPGVSLELQRTDDGGNQGTLLLHDAPAEAIAGDPTEPLETAMLAHAAYLIGVIGRALELTQAAMLQRETFGRFIGALPAQQHRAADMEVQVGLTRAAIGTAAEALDGDAPLPARQAAVSRARLRTTDAAVVVGRACTELSGGVVPDTSDLSLCLRKAATLVPLYGSAAAHRARSRIAAGAPRHG